MLLRIIRITTFCVWRFLLEFSHFGSLLPITNFCRSCPSLLCLFLNSLILLPISKFVIDVLLKVSKSWENLLLALLQLGEAISYNEPRFPWSVFTSVWRVIHLIFCSGTVPSCLQAGESAITCSRVWICWYLALIALFFCTKSCQWIDCLSIGSTKKYVPAYIISSV